MGDNGDRLSRRDYVRGIGAAGALSISGLSGCSALGLGGSSEPDVYTIAATVPKSGRFSDIGDAMERGYQYGATSENASANVAEFIDDEFNLVVRDDESSADTVTSQLEDVAGDNEINMVWGSYGNGPSQAGADFAESEGVPFLGPFWPHEQPHTDNEYNWVFPPTLKSSGIAASTAAHLDEIPDENRPSTVGIWEPNSDWGTEMADRWETALGEAESSYDVALREQFEPGAEEFGDLVSQSMDQEVEVLLSNPSQASGIAAMQALKSADWTPSAIVFPRAADRPGWWSELGSDGEYVMATPGWVPGLTADGNTGLWSNFPSEYDLGENELIPVGSGGAYTVTQMVRGAFQETDPFNAEDVQSNLQEDDYQTAIGEIGFDENGIPIDDENYDAPIGQWYDNTQADVDEGRDQEQLEGAPRRVFPREDSYYGMNLKFPVPAWGDR